MSLDSNDLCPGGTGKKIKHCNCRDILSELHRVGRALEGEQRVAALERVNRLLVTRANRPCLLALKCAALLGMKKLQELEETVAIFQQVAPENPVAATYAALLNVVKQDIPGAIASLQTALSNTGTQVPGELFEAIRLVGSVLLESGHAVAARAHFLLRVRFLKNEQTTGELLEISRIEDIPPILKTQLSFLPCPSDVPWKDRLHEAIVGAHSGAWQVALGKLLALDEEVPNQPSILKNIAILSAFLAKPDAAQAWHRYAALPSLEEDEAVLSEAMAQALDTRITRDDTVPVVRTILPLTDARAAMEKLLSSQQTIAAEFDVFWIDESSAPAAATFHILDRPEVASFAQLGDQPAPLLVGQVAFFGKQTDRDARLELLSISRRDIDTAVSVLRDVLGDLMGAPESQETGDRVSRIRAEFFRSIAFPEDTPPYEKWRLSHETTRNHLQDGWPRFSLLELDGKTPEEVSKDPAYQTRLSAVLLLLDHLVEANGWPLDTDLLRRQLDLPVAASRTLKEDSWVPAWPVLWSHIDLKSLSDAELLRLFQRSMAYGLRTALRKQIGEMLERNMEIPEDAGFDRAMLYERLAALSFDLVEQRDLLLKARAEAEKLGKSPAQYMLAEIPIRLAIGDDTEAGHLVNRLQTQHVNEPGISDGLLRLFQQLGLVDQNGEPIEGPPAKQEDAEPEGKLWTPDQGSAPAPSQQENGESKLWVPGMD